MRSTLLIAALGLALAAPALAQDATTQSPPTPNAQTNQPAAANSVPAGSATSTGTRPGDTVGRTTTTPPPATTTPSR